MTTRNVTANYNNCRQSKTTPVYQYNYGQVLLLNGFKFLPEVFEMHFSNDKQFGKSITMIGRDGAVEIPDELLANGRDIWAWLYLHETAEDGETVYIIQIPVIRRAEITNEEPTPVQQDAITQAIAALNEAVGKTAADAERAETAAETAVTAAGRAEEALAEFVHILEDGNLVFDDGDASDLPDESEGGEGG